ncbi:MAG: Hint domain-containing protein [bacterium]
MNLLPNKHIFKKAIFFSAFIGCSSLLIPANAIAQEEYCETPECYTYEFTIPEPCTATPCYYAGTACAGTKDVYMIVEEDPCYEYLYIGCGGCGGSGCFLADTKIATPGGEMNIQDVKVGDTVVGIDPETGERVETQVQDTHKTVVEEYYEVTIEKPDGTEEVLKVTGEHPLLVKKRPTVGNILQALIGKISNIFRF